MYLYNVGILIGAIAIADTIKPEATVAINALTKMGLRVILLTGDSRWTARAIAEEVGIHNPNIFAEVLPSHKKNKVAELQEQGYKVGIGCDKLLDTNCHSLTHSLTHPPTLSFFLGVCQSGCNGR